MKLLYTLFAVCFVTVLISSFSGISHSPTPFNLDYNPTLGKPFLPVGNPLTMEGIRLGRLLFYDTLLSGTNTQSCGSCHIQKYSFTDGKKLAIGSKNDTVDKNTMSLVNLAWNTRFFWDGRVRFLEEVIPQPIANKKEMDQDTAELIRELTGHRYYPKLFNDAFPGEKVSMFSVSKAIAQFVRTITSEGIVLPDSIFNKSEYAYKDSLQLEANYREELSMRGSFYRFAFMCSNCHGGTNYGGTRMADNMIETGTRFKAPTLLNIALTAPYMHDGRFKNIEEVLEHYNGHISQMHIQNPRLLEKPIENVIREYDKKEFVKLITLFTDSSVLKNKALGNPFEEKRFKW